MFINYPENFLIQVTSQLGGYINAPQKQLRVKLSQGTLCCWDGCCFINNKKKRKKTTTMYLTFCWCHIDYNIVLMKSEIRFEHEHRKNCKAPALTPEGIYSNSCFRVSQPLRALKWQTWRFIFSLNLNTDVIVLMWPRQGTNFVSFSFSNTFILWRKPIVTLVVCV